MGRGRGDGREGQGVVVRACMRVCVFEWRAFRLLLLSEQTLHRILSL